jgi:hypothetical protein
MLNLDLNQLAVESFETNVAGDPSQWLMAPPPSDDTECDTCDDLYAPTPDTSCGCVDR